MSEPTGRRVLLADDCQMTREAMANILQLKGWQVTTVANGRDAVQAVQDVPFDVVLFDVQMPGMDGLEAARAIRQLPLPFCRVPIIGITAHTYRADLEKCTAAGMNLWVAKPINFRVLEEEMNRLLQTTPSATARDEAMLDILDELHRAAGEDSSAVHVAIRSYLEAYGEQLQQVAAAVVRGDAGELQKSAHRLAGSVGFFSRGAPLLLARQLSEMGAQNRLEQAPEKLALLQMEMKQLSQRLEDVWSEKYSRTSS